MRLLISLSALTLFALAAPAQAEPATSALDAIAQAGTLRVCTPGDYKPFSFQKPDGSYQGLDIDLMQSLAKSLNARIEYVKTSWPKLMEDFVAGKCDIAAGGISATLERQKRAFFSAPYFVNGKVPLARCEDRAKYQTVADIDRPDVRVITNPGGTNERFAKGNFTHAKLTVHAENLSIFDELLAKRADVFVTESAEARVQQKERPGLCAVNVDKPLLYSENAYLLPRGDAAWKAYVDQWLHLAQAGGEFQKLMENWIPR